MKIFKFSPDCGRKFGKLRGVSVYLRAIRFFRPYLWPTLGGVVLMFIAIALNLLKFWPIRYLLDGVLPTDPSQGTQEAREFISHWLPGASPMVAAMWLCGSMVTLSLGWGLFNLASNFLFLRVGLRALLRMRTDLYAYLQSLPLKYHDNKRSSDSSFRVAYDSQSVQTLYSRGFVSVLGSSVTLIGAFAIMWNINWQLSLCSLAILPFLAVAIRFYAERVRKHSTAIQERESDLLAVTQEGLSQIRMVHAFGREDFEIDQFHQRAKRSLEANLRLNITSVSSTLVVGTLMAVGTAVMYYVGAQQVLAGNLTIGFLVMFASYLVMLYQPLEQLSYTAWALEGAAAAATRCFEVLDRENDVPDMPGAVKMPPVKGAVSFRNVSFGYTDERQILHDITLDVPAGMPVAFVGGTGAGKSTLLSLVPRFYDPTAGTMLIDGMDLKSVTKKSLRAQIGMVLQDTVLFSTTVRENIAYGRPGATDAEIREAAKRAQALDFIEKLPLGFDNQVGERGSHLSVGQRQRIGIARAFLKNAPILLLDEPTSALDPATEAAIMDTIEDLMKGRTTLIITHRLATVHHIGHIVVLENGRMAEHGTGPELLARGGAYATLYNAGQFGE